jgi:hypothetical protein
LFVVVLIWQWSSLPKHQVRHLPLEIPQLPCRLLQVAALLVSAPSKSANQPGTESSRSFRRRVLAPCQHDLLVRIPLDSGIDDFLV